MNNDYYGCLKCGREVHAEQLCRSHHTQAAMLKKMNCKPRKR